MLPTNRAVAPDSGHTSARRGIESLQSAATSEFHRKTWTLMASAALGRDRIGELLVRENLISQEDLDRALAEQSQNGARVGFTLVASGAVSETDLTRILSRQFRVPAVDLETTKVDPKILKLVPADFASKHLVLPLRRVGRTLTIAMASPSDLGVIDDLKFITRFDIEAVVAGEYSLRQAID